MKLASPGGRPSSALRPPVPALLAFSEAPSASRRSAHRLKLVMILPAAEQSQTKMQGLTRRYEISNRYQRNNRPAHLPNQLCKSYRLTGMYCVKPVCKPLSF